MEAVLDFSLLFFKISFYPIGIFIICGLIIALCERLVVHLCGHGGRGVIYATSIVGTPVHESGHALMCLLFGHKITDMRLWCPLRSDGTLGYVEHTYKKKNIYMVLGNMFIGMGPIFSGLLFTFLVMLLCFPQAFKGYILSVFSGGYSSFDLSDLLSDGRYMLEDMISDSSRHVVIKIIGAILIMSTCLHINLSIADIKNSLSSLPVYLLITMMLSILVYFIGGSFDYFVLGGLSTWLYMGFSLYLPVIIAALFIVLIAFIVCIIRNLLPKKAYKN